MRPTWRSRPASAPPFWNRSGCGPRPFPLRMHERTHRSRPGGQVWNDEDPGSGAAGHLPAHPVGHAAGIVPEVGGAFLRQPERMVGPAPPKRDTYAIARIATPRPISPGRGRSSAASGFLPSSAKARCRLDDRRGWPGPRRPVWWRVWADHTTMPVRHYGRVREELRRRRQDLASLISPACPEGMDCGLGHWIEGGRRGDLGWGLVRFRMLHGN